MRIRAIDRIMKLNLLGEESITAQLEVKLLPAELELIVHQLRNSNIDVEAHIIVDKKSLDMGREG